MLMDGDTLSRHLMQLAAACRNCGAVIKFQEGATLAKNKGIRDQVVMCKKCQAVYTVNITLRALTLVLDVTNDYAPQPAAEQSAIQEGAMKTDDSDEYEYCCSECDGVIGPEAETCPHCGADTSSLVESQPKIDERDNQIVQFGNKGQSASEEAYLEASKHTTTKKRKGLGLFVFFMSVFVVSLVYSNLPYGTPFNGGDYGRASGHAVAILTFIPMIASGIRWLVLR